MSQVGYRHPLHLGVVAALAALLCAALAAHAYIGLFTRLIADDYATASALRAHGFFGSQRFWYENWSGRFTFSFLVALTHLITPGIVPWLPLIALLVWTGAMMWVVFQFDFGAPTSPLTAVLLSTLPIVATLEVIPTIYQSLYWMTGMLTYIAPLILFVVLFGIVVKASRSERSSSRIPLLTLTGIIALMACGLSETTAAPQLAGLSLAIVVVILFGTQKTRRSTLAPLIAALAGSIVGALFTVLAPGNHVRIADEASRVVGVAPLGSVFFIKGSLKFAIESIQMCVVSGRTKTLACLVVPALIALSVGKTEIAGFRQRHDSLIRALWIIPLFAAILIGVCFVPTAYVAAFVRNGYVSQPRIYVVPHFIYFVACCSWSYIAGLALVGLLPVTAINSKALNLVSCLILAAFIVVPFRSMRRTLSLASTVKPYAMAWENQDRALREAKLQGVSRPEVPALPHDGRDQNGLLFFGLRLVGPNSEYWVNQCAANWYGFESIVAREQAQPEKLQ